MPATRATRTPLLAGRAHGALLRDPVRLIANWYQTDGRGDTGVQNGKNRGISRIAAVAKITLSGRPTRTKSEKR